MMSNKGAEWHSNEELWKAMGIPMFNKSRMEAGKQEVQQMISLLDLRQSDHLLDLCCGNGRHLLEFTRKGYHVTGVDVTACYLDELKNTAQQENLEVDVIHQDARLYRAPNTYNAAYNLYASFGYFENEQDNLLLLKNIHASLRKGGKFLVNIAEKNMTKARLAPLMSYEAEGTLCTFNQSLSHDERWLQFNTTFTRKNSTETIDYRIRLYEVPEICALLEEAGFEEIHHYGDMSGSAYHANSPELFVEARK